MKRAIVEMKTLSSSVLLDGERYTTASRSVSLRDDEISGMWYHSCVRTGMCLT